LAACVEAGKHVFAEKPVAVDPKGVRQFIETGELAKKKGLAVLEQDGPQYITGENKWRYREPKLDSRQQEHTDMIESIRNGNPVNDARRIAESTLTAILGREAAYTGNVIEWDTILNSQLDLVPKKFEFGPLPVRPVPKPGKYKLI